MPAAGRHPRAPRRPSGELGVRARDGRSGGQPGSGIRPTSPPRWCASGPPSTRAPGRPGASTPRTFASWTNSSVAGGWAPPSRRTPGSGRGDDRPLPGAARRDGLARREQVRGRVRDRAIPARARAGGAAGDLGFLGRARRGLVLPAGPGARHRDSLCRSGGPAIAGRCQAPGAGLRRWRRAHVAGDA